MANSFTRVWNITFTFYNGTICHLSYQFNELCRGRNYTTTDTQQFTSRFKRFLHISILKNTLTPLHDHVRKRMGWSDEQVVARWLILQAVASALLLLMTR